MADVRLGGAYIEVTADLTKANQQIAAWGAKSAPVQKNIIANQNQQTAAIKKTIEATSEHVQKMRELLEVSQKAALVSARSAQVGAPVKAGSTKAMMGAQLTYALQDLLTGLSMGNINQALLGMSNNLSMIAMLWGGVGASITSIAVAALPLLYTGMKAFLGQQDDAKEKEDRLREAVERVNIAFERRMSLFQHQAALRRAGEPIELGEIKHAGEAQARIRDAEREIKQAQADSDRAVQELKVIGEEKGTIGVNVTPAGGVEKNIKRGDAAVLLRQRMKDVEHLENAPKDMFDLFDRDKQIAHAKEMLEKERKRIAVEAGFDDTHRAYLSAQGKIDIIRQRTTEEIAAREKKEAEWKKVGEDAAKTIAVNQEKLPELTKRRDELLHREIRFSERSMAAGFNAYEQAKIRLDREQEESEIQIKKDYGGVILKPGITKEDRKKQIESQYEEDLRESVRARREMEDEQGKKGRLLGLKRAKIITEMDAKALERRDKALAENEASGGVSAVTAADKMLEGNREEFRRKRIQLAEQFAGGKTGFAGITGLSNQIQTGLGGRGMTLPEQTTAIVKGQEKATQDLISFMTNTGIKIQGGGLK